MKTERETKPIKTKLHYYRYDLHDATQEREYRALCERLRDMGLEKFAAIGLNDSQFLSEHIEALHNKTVTLETEYLFNNQWNSAPTKTSDKGLRLMDWAEPIFPNRSIKRGYWLEQTQEMIRVRAKTLKCGYCGAHYDSEKTEQKFCSSCLDSEYLKEKDLPLLRLRAVSKKDHIFEPLTEAERAEIIPVYVTRQTTGADSRNARKLARQRQEIKDDYKKKTEDAKTEHDALLWLMDHNVSIDNVIYYNHTGRFSFGWRSPVSKTVKSKLLDILVEFPFDYDIQEEK